jgi:hypothetical protein
MPQSVAVVGASTHTAVPREASCSSSRTASSNPDGSALRRRRDDLQQFTPLTPGRVAIGVHRASGKSDAVTWRE